MWVITVDDIATGHEAVIKLLLTKGDMIDLEDRGYNKAQLTFEYPEPVCIHINNPISSHMCSEALAMGIRGCEAYYEQLTSLHPMNETAATYYYSNRLGDYPRAGPGYYREGNGTGNGINQIYKSIIERLANQPDSRRAIAITWVPQWDIQSDEPPCVQIIQCFIRDDRLNMILYIRSNDMLSAWGENAFGFARLQHDICMSLKEKHKGLMMGWLETISASAHMYWKRDAEELKKFRRVLGV